MIGSASSCSPNGGRDVKGRLQVPQLRGGKTGASKGPAAIPGRIPAGRLIGERQDRIVASRIHDRVSSGRVEAVPAGSSPASIGLPGRTTPVVLGA